MDLALLEAQLADPSLRAEAARALAEAHREAGRSAPLTRALEVLAITTREPTEEARVLAELGRTRFALAQDEEAFLAFARALYLAPTDAGVLAELRALGTAARAAAVVRELLVDAVAEARAPLEAWLAQQGQGTAAR